MVAMFLAVNIRECGFSKSKDCQQLKERGGKYRPPHVLVLSFDVHAFCLCHCGKKILNAGSGWAIRQLEMALFGTAADVQPVD